MDRLSLSVLPLILSFCSFCFRALLNVLSPLTPLASSDVMSSFDSFFIGSEAGELIETVLCLFFPSALAASAS